MFSRFVILILLVLVPFQSFAAVGLIECQAPGLIAPGASGSSAHHATGNGNVPAQSMRHSHDAGMPHHAVTGQLAAAGAPDAHLSHHVHKLPCCSDAPIIFSHALPDGPGSERFVMAIAPQVDGVTSVFLEGPKRPPRLSFS
ncbi:MAG: hypothetical protein H7244_01215 [Herminiimonas sp.]|nr:hypothetical protein [Herminiimonas sp.]